MDSIEPRVHKDINDYTPRYYFGLTARQILASILIMVTEIPLYFYLRTLMSDNNASWIVIITSVPFVTWGFVKIQGMNAETIVKNIFRNYFTYAKPISYKTEKELQWEREQKRLYKLKRLVKEKFKFKKKEKTNYE
ncbi:MAG: PrgI family protein [Coprobacillaceae bacterium]